MKQDIQNSLHQLALDGRRRDCRLSSGIDLTSNDYLGLRNHPALRAAAIAALQGGLEIGAGGSRLLRGHHAAHEALEHFAARHFAAPAALYCGSGYQANLALFTALPDRRDVILFDALIHASARDGIQASLARHMRVPHNDLAGFEAAIKAAKLRARHVWIAAESVYSMDGDLAPLPQLYELARHYGATLVVDEAHGSGVFGATGKGLSEGLAYDHMIALHTCGKAMGVAGGLICADRAVIDWLINRARSFIYATAPMPLQALLVQKALAIMEGEPQRREALWDLHRLARDILPADVGASPIIPIMVGADRDAVQLAEALQRDGFDIRAIRSPTVPDGSARLRLSLRADLAEQNLRDFAAALRRHKGE